MTTQDTDVGRSFTPHDAKFNPFGDGPPPFGAEYNPFDPEFRKDPHVFFDKARVQARVCHNPVFDMWLVTGYDEVLQVCDDPVLFSSKNKVDPPNDVKPEVLEILNTQGFPVVLQLFNSDPPEHDRIATLVHKGFTRSSHVATEPGILELANGYIDGFVDTGAVDLHSAYCDPLPLTVILDYIGVPREDHEQIGIWDDWWARLFTSAHAIEEQMEAVHQVVAYQHYWNDFIDRRRADPVDDLTSRLVTAEVDGLEPLRNEEMVWQFMGLLAAGHATTTDAMTNLLLVLLRKPALWQSLCADPDKLPAFIEEGLRYVNPVLGLPRITTRAVELGGVEIPAGAQVLVSYCAANRDEKMTPDPHRFDPGRKAVGRHLAFGRGIHYCVGARMSKTMMRIAIGQLVERLPGFRLQPGYEPEYNTHPFLWGLARLPVEWDVPAST